MFESDKWCKYYHNSVRWALTRSDLLSVRHLANEGIDWRLESDDRKMTRLSSAWHATQTVPLAHTVRIHCVLQSTSPSPVPLSFFSSFSSSCSRVKISLGFLYWRRERRQRFTCTFSSSLSRKSLNVLALLKGQDKENTRAKWIYSWNEAEIATNIMLFFLLFVFFLSKQKYGLKQSKIMYIDIYGTWNFK